MKEDLIYIRHMHEAICKIEDYINKKGKDYFMDNPLLQDAIIRQIEIIGEASKRVSSKTIKNYPQIPWKDIAGMRDKLIHGYFGVDLVSVWNTVCKDIPVLKLELKNILTEIEG